ncbi:DUF4190 domain-containing protein [Kitasatospora phosalacinea]|uniref:DUF4190 domain-containing protein n=1 Tax=Kitasatospora phosalacinea TaxID=2065 RepID=UPI0035DA10C3
MSFDQERTGKDEPDAARHDAPPAPPALSLEKTAPDAEPDVEPEPEPGPAVSFAKRAIPGDGDGDVDSDGDGDAAEAAQAPANPWARPAGSTPSEAPPAVPVPAPAPAAGPAPAEAADPWAKPAAPAPSEAPPATPAPAPVPAPTPAGPVNPWAAPAPGPVPAAPAAAAGQGAPVAPANPWAPTGVHQPWGNGAYPPGAVQAPGQVPGPGGMPGYPGYPQPPRSLYNNGLAIAALVVSFLCYLGIIAIGLGIAALVQIKRTGERGKAMAVSAIVIGTVWLLLLVLAIVAGAFADGYEDDSDSSGGRGTATHYAGGGLPPLSPLHLNIGDCADLTGRTAAEEAGCSSLHDAEVFWAGASASQGDYPGEKVLRDEANELCSHHLDEYVMDTWSIPETTDFQSAYPQRGTWDAIGGRRIVCFLKSEDPTAGSMRKDRSNLTSDQVQFLEATNQFDRLWIDEPDEDLDVADDPEAFRTWAGQLAVGADKQVAMLEAAHWTDVDKSTVNQLVKETEVAARHFRAAAAARDSVTIEDEISTAHEHLGDDYIHDLRRALKLTTADEGPVKDPSGQLV